MRFLKRIIRWLATPFLNLVKRFLNNRFREMENRIADRVERLAVSGSASTAVTELLGHVGQRLRQLVEEVREQGARIDALEEQWRASRPGAKPWDEIRSLEQLDPSAAAALNFAEGAEGFRAQAGLRFDGPVRVRYVAGGVELAGVDEAIVSFPYVFAALAKLEAGARILVASGDASTIPLSLAALGYRVTQVDRGRTLFGHPNLERREASLDSWRSPPLHFDAIVCSSFLEHVGLDASQDAYPDVDADLRAMDHLGSLAKADGLLVFTAPFGRFDVGAQRRTYDRTALDRMLRGWDVDDFRTGFLDDHGAWQTVTGADRADEILAAGRPAVVLATARRSRLQDNV